jgi:hypothetical protein
MKDGLGGVRSVGEESYFNALEQQPFADTDVGKRD